MAHSGTALRPLPVQIARNFALWLMFIPIIFILLSPIGTAPLPGPDGWMRLAMVGVPFLLAGAVVGAVSARARHVVYEATSIGARMSKKLQAFETPGIAVSFDPNLCTHSAMCVRGLPAVFDTKRSRWIRPELATPEEVAAQVAKCPSGALQATLTSK